MTQEKEMSESRKNLLERIECVIDAIKATKFKPNSCTNICAEFNVGYNVMIALHQLGYLNKEGRAYSYSGMTAEPKFALKVVELYSKINIETQEEYKETKRLKDLANQTHFVKEIEKDVKANDEDIDPTKTEQAKLATMDDLLKAINANTDMLKLIWMFNKPSSEISLMPIQKQNGQAKHEEVTS